MPGAYFRLILDLVGRTPALRQALLEGTGLTRELLERPGSGVTLGQQLRQVRNANRILPGGWALAVGARLQTPTHGPLGFGAVSASTLGAALEMLERFTHVRNPGFEAIATRRGGEHGLVFHPRCDLLDEERLPLLETLLLSVQSVLESVLGRDLDEGGVEIAGRPAYAARYRDYFHVPVHFDAGQDAFVIPADWLERPCPLADPEMYETSVRKLEEMADRLESDVHVASRVARLLASGSDAGLPIEAMARRLGYSSRTLIRRLREAGVTYRELRDGHRRRRAERLMADPDLTLAQIAARLGYEDASNFARACRRWFGITPRATRELLRGPDPHAASAPLRVAV